MELNPENICKDFAPSEIEELPETDSLKIMFNMQKSLQDRLGQLDRYNKADMREKCLIAMENLYHFNAEMVEFMERLPFKHWKKYSEKALNGWVSEEQRKETIFEAVDAFHFFMNLLIVFGITVDEFFSYYKEKNKENFRRQDSGKY